jgi:hypothetical protein
MNYLERLRKPRATGLLALAALLFFFAACQLVAGVQSRTLDPIASGCALPTGSGPQVRFANLAPNPDALDICIRSSGSSWGEPLILNGGTTCSSLFPSKGFTYSQISIPFAAPGETVDVKTVLGGGTCNASAVAELDGVKLLSAPACTASACVTTLIALGGAASQPKKLVALPEFDSNTPQAAPFRFVNALAGVGEIDVGTVPKPTSGTAALPASLTPPAWNMSNGIPYGETMKKGQLSFFGPVADDGYMSVIANVNFNMVVTAHGQTDGLLLFPALETGDATTSLYAVGLAYNDSYPLQGLLCTESTTVTGSNPLLVGCTTSALPTLSFDAFNAALYGPNSPYFSLRDPQYAAGPGASPPNPIATRNSDAMCLVEVDEGSDQQSIITAVKGGNFNYSYTIMTNPQTAFSNGGVEQDGGACPTMGQPACSAAAMSGVNNAFMCMEQYCSSNGAMGTLNQSTDCLTSNCPNSLGGLLLEFPECLDCIVANVTSEQPYDAALNTCTTSPYPPLGYQGAENSLILSKYPIVNSDSYVLPSSYYRRSVLYTQVQFPGNVTIDFFCGFLQTLGIASDVPYQGCFGNGATSSEQGYANENLYEAQLMAAWIQEKSKKSGNPAVILGDWHTGLGSTVTAAADAGYPAPTPIGAATITFLSTPVSMGGGGLTAVSGPDWPAAGQCTDCPGTVNLLNVGNTTSYFTMQPFLYNWPAGSGTLHSEQLTFTDNVIAIPPSTTNNAPISPYYGLNVQILRPPPKAAQGDAGAAQ